MRNAVWKCNVCQFCGEERALSLSAEVVRSRTTKRRSQHKAANPNTQACPSCGEPRLAHRVCSNCGTYRGRTVVNVQN